MMTFKEFLALQSSKPMTNNKLNGMQVIKDLRDGEKPEFFKPPEFSSIKSSTKPSFLPPEAKKKWDTKFQNRFKIRKGSGLDISAS